MPRLTNYLDVRDVAASYLDRGWSVIPIKNKSKAPVYRWEEYQHRLPTPLEVRRWRWQENIAIVTGRVSGLVVIDQDDLTNLTPEEHKIATQFMRSLPSSAAVVTSKGVHKYFTLPRNEDGSYALLEGRIRFLPGIDCKAEGGYVIAPPSTHATTGDTYVWAYEEGPDEIVEIPDDVLDMVRRAPMLSAWTKSSLSMPVESGKRNDTLASRAGALLANRNPEEFEDLYEAFKSYNKRMCKPPVIERELEQIWKSITQREIAQGRFTTSAAPIPEPTQVVDAADGLANPPPRTPHVIEGLLPYGLATIAGKPKTGKSLLGIQLAAAVALGGLPFNGLAAKALGIATAIKKGHVLYLALEDSDERFLYRLNHICGPLAKSIERGSFKFFTTFPPMFEGGVDRIAKELDNDPELRLVVIDTLAAFTGGAVAKRGENAFAAEYRMIRPLFDIAKTHDCAILVIQHARKDMKGQTDPWDSVSGTLGTPAAADTLMILHEKHQPGKRPQVILLGKGRDIEDFEIPLIHRGKMTWSIGTNGGEE